MSDDDAVVARRAVVYTLRAAAEAGAWDLWPVVAVVMAGERGAGFGVALLDCATSVWAPGLVPGLRALAGDVPPVTPDARDWWADAGLRVAGALLVAERVHPEARLVLGVSARAAWVGSQERGLPVHPGVDRVDPGAAGDAGVLVEELRAVLAALAVSRAEVLG